MNRRVVYIFLAITIILELIGLFVLPEELVMQVSSSGEANWTLGKPLALLFLFGFSILGTVVSLSRSDNNSRNYLLMVIILVIHILLFVFNL